jgi:anti-anti-sigma regulatory factor
MPEVLGIKASVTPVRTSPSRLEDEPAWRSPTHLTQSGVDELQLALANAPSPWFIDWGATEALAANAIGPLADVVAQWAKSPVQLRFRNVHQLERALRAVTPPGNKSINQAAWQLRMDVLRILGLQDDFELVALEHCVTYEVSPPSWEPMPATLVAVASGSMRASAWAAGPSVLAGDDAVELIGNLEGRIQDVLLALREHAADRREVVLQCRRLVRVDFGAAGELLNEIVALKAAGKYLRLRDVNHLVAALLSVMGIPELADVRLRRL